METVAQNAAERTNRESRAGTVDVGRPTPTPIQRIESTLDEMVHRINLIEFAVAGALDEPFYVLTFQQSLGDLIRCKEEIDDALVEIRAEKPAAPSATSTTRTVRSADVRDWIEGMGEEIAMLHDHVADISRTVRGLADGENGKNSLTDRVEAYNGLRGHALNVLERANDLGGYLSLLREECST